MADFMETICFFTYTIKMYLILIQNHTLASVNYYICGTRYATL